MLSRALLLLLVCFPLTVAGIHAQDSPHDLAQIIPSPTHGSLRALLLYSAASGDAMPGEGEAYLLFVPDGGPSPLDSLSMSPLERVFWSKKGLFRITGLFPVHPDNPTDDLRQIARVRRRMLSMHQVLGLATVASMTATVVGGQRALNGNGAGLHETSLPITIGLYATTATLALASPPGLVPSRGGIDTITFHKAFAVLHLAGMIITPMLAPDVEEGTWSRRHVHQAMGYGTFAAFTGGMLTVMLFR